MPVLSHILTKKASSVWQRYCTVMLASHTADVDLRWSYDGGILNFARSLSQSWSPREATGEAHTIYAETMPHDPTRTSYDYHTNATRRAAFKKKFNRRTYEGYTMDFWHIYDSTMRSDYVTTLSRLRHERIIWLFEGGESIWSSLTHTAILANTGN